MFPPFFFKELPFSADSLSPRYITSVSNTITISNTLTLLLQKWICSFHRASFQKLSRSLDGGDACFRIFLKRNREIYERREKPRSRLSWKVHNGNNLSVSGCPYQACLMWGVNRWNTDIDKRWKYKYKYISILNPANASLIPNGKKYLEDNLNLIFSGYLLELMCSMLIGSYVIGSWCPIGQYLVSILQELFWLKWFYQILKTGNGWGQYW